MCEIKTLNGYEIADVKARSELAVLAEEIEKRKKKGIFDVSARLTDASQKDISSFLCSVFRDIYIEGVDNKETYAIGRITRTTEGILHIDVWKSEYLVVLGAYIVDTTDYAGVKTVDLKEINSSGMYGKITIDFDVLLCGINYEGIPFASTKISRDYLQGSLMEQMLLKSNEYTPFVRRWENKRWYAIGDSFTEQNIYPYYLNEYCKFASYYNAGQSGLGMSHMADKLSIEPLTDYDIVTVLAGTNDYGGNTKLGLLSDPPTANTFYGYCKKVIERIVTQKPTIRIAFFTPTKRGKFENQPVYPNANGIGVTLEQYVDAIKEVCSLYSIPCCDTFRTSQFSELTLSTLTQDNLHPNYDGGKLLARQMQGFIEVI